MSENIQNKQGFVGYEYKSVTIKRDMVDLYTDCLPNFGWVLEKSIQSLTPASVTMKFKRDRKVINKAELTRLQREFESHANEINKLEVSKIARASTIAYIIGVIGTALMAGSVFAVTSDMILLCIILAVPAFIGWVIPYFCFQHISAKRTEQIAPLIDNQYNSIYAVCEKASALLYN